MRKKQNASPQLSRDRLRRGSVEMLELIQFPWSTFCLVQRRILEYSGTKFKITDISPNDRSLVWKMSRKRY